MNSEAIVISGLLGKLIDFVQADQVRAHEKRIKELEIICSSSLRDSYVQQLLLDKFLTPVETAQHQIQNAAKHANWIAGKIIYYHQDHKATRKQGQEISAELRVLATKITQANSLDELKVIYGAVNLFAAQLTDWGFTHPNEKYSLQHTIREGILNVLNTCIATENNFQRRVAWVAPQDAVSQSV